MANEIEEVTSNLCIDSSSAFTEPVYDMLYEYVAKWQPYLLRQVSKAIS